MRPSYGYDGHVLNGCTRCLRLLQQCIIFRCNPLSLKVTSSQNPAKTQPRCITFRGLMLPHFVRGAGNVSQPKQSGSGLHPALETTNERFRGLRLGDRTAGVRCTTPTIPCVRCARSLLGVSLRILRGGRIWPAMFQNVLIGLNHCDTVDPTGPVQGNMQRRGGGFRDSRC